MLWKKTFVSREKVSRPTHNSATSKIDFKEDYVFRWSWIFVTTSSHQSVSTDSPRTVQIHCRLPSDDEPVKILMNNVSGSTWPLRFFDFCQISIIPVPWWQFPDHYENEIQLPLCSSEVITCSNSLGSVFFSHSWFYLEVLREDKELTICFRSVTFRDTKLSVSPHVNYSKSTVHVTQMKRHCTLSSRSLMSCY